VLAAARALLVFLRRFEQVATAAAFALMVLVLGWDILGRELLSGGKIWATPIAVYCNVAIAFIGMGVASAGGAHLRPKFLDGSVPRGWAPFFDRLTDIGFALFSAGACWLCLAVTRESVQLQETDPVLQWPVWPFQTILVAAFGIAVVRHTLYALWPVLRPKDSGGENAPPSEEQVREYATPAAMEKGR
jgi:TRAP-type C4-dicarboxylate transport system permease small subunit